MAEVRRSEIAAAAWRERYVAGACDLDEMEAGIARALAGECSDAEWLDLAAERRRAVLLAGLYRPQTLEATDAILKSLYHGPIAH